MDRRSDLYAVGLMAFQMLTGERAIGLEMPSDIRPSLDRGWDDWVKRAVATSPERRFSAAEEMRETLPGKDGRPSPAHDGPEREAMRVVRDDASGQRPRSGGGGRAPLLLRQERCHKGSDVGRALLERPERGLTNRDATLIAAWLDDEMRDAALAVRMRKLAEDEQLADGERLVAAASLLNGGETVFPGKGVFDEARLERIDPSEAADPFRVGLALESVWVQNALTRWARTVADRKERLLKGGLPVDPECVWKRVLQPASVLLDEARAFQGELLSSSNDTFSRIIRDGINDEYDALALLCANRDALRTKAEVWEKRLKDERQRLEVVLEVFEAELGSEFLRAVWEKSDVPTAGPMRLVSSDLVCRAQTIYSDVRKNLEETVRELWTDVGERQAVDPEISKTLSPLKELLERLDDVLRHQRGVPELVDAGRLEEARQWLERGLRVFEGVHYENALSLLAQREAPWEDALAQVESLKQEVDFRWWWRIVPLGHAIASPRLRGWNSRASELAAALERATAEEIEGLDDASRDRALDRIDDGQRELAGLEARVNSWRRRALVWGCTALIFWLLVGFLPWLWINLGKTSLRVEVNPRDVLEKVFRSAKGEIEAQSLDVEMEEARGPVAGENAVVELAGGVELDLVWIRPGEFTMGSPSNEAGRFRDSEGPQTHVRLTRGYWLGKTPVTQGQWQALMGSNPSHFKQSGLNAPVENVSWTQAMEFCRRLTERERAAGRLSEGYVFTLPSEAQWEYAARAGTTTRWSFGDNENQLGEYAWFTGNSGRQTRPVGTKRPNPWGLYEVHGNVWEWTRTWYGDYPGGSVTDYEGPASGSFRVNRGGSGSLTARHTRSATRDGLTPGYRYQYLGFRLALAPSP